MITRAIAFESDYTFGQSALDWVIKVEAITVNITYNNDKEEFWVSCAPSTPIAFQKLIASALEVSGLFKAKRAVNSAVQELEKELTKQFLASHLANNQ